MYAIAIIYVVGLSFGRTAIVRVRERVLVSTMSRLPFIRGKGSNCWSIGVCADCTADHKEQKRWITNDHSGKSYAISYDLLTIRMTDPT
jgi:hypothetical protein